MLEEYDLTEIRDTLFLFFKDGFDTEYRLQKLMIFLSKKMLIWFFLIYTSIW